MACFEAPNGWQCTRREGHKGPCAAIPTSEPDDTQMLNWLSSSNITSEDASDIVNGFRWRGKFRGGIREAIRTAMKEIS